MQAPQPSPLAAFGAWWNARTRAIQGAIGCGALIAICACCSLGAAALHPSSGNTSAATAPTATHAPAGPKATATATHALVWTTVHTFKGNGTGKTPPFQESASQWRLLWNCDPHAYGFDYNLSVEVKSPTDPTVYDLAVNVICHDPTVTHGDTMEYVSGQLYLDISSEASWTLTIQELR